ncbi:MAG: hypothetical protein M3121_05920 [Chloroflexota bacterium]|nr:hypothetical protein [Chloroflexota bacterium]
MAKLLTLFGLAFVLVLGGATLVVAQSGTVQEQEGEDTGEPAGACPSPGDLTGTPDVFAEASPTADVPEAFDADATPQSSPGATGGVATPPNLECPSPEAGS